MKISAKFKNRFLKILKRIHKSKYLEEIYLYSSHSIILKISGKFEDRTIFKNAKKKKILHSTESIYVFFYYIFYWSFETIVDRVTSASRGSLFPADDGQIRLFGLRHAQNKGTSLPGEGPGGGGRREGGREGRVRLRPRSFPRVARPAPLSTNFRYKVLIVANIRWLDDSSRKGRGSRAEGPGEAPFEFLFGNEDFKFSRLFRTEESG